MFYILSKIIGLFITPIVWIVGLFIWGILSRNKNRKRKLMSIGISLLLFFSNTFIFHEFIRHWEQPAINHKHIETKYNYGIVLSGMTWYNSEAKRITFMRSSDRIWQAVQLYHEGIIDKILITGGAAEFFGRDTVESAILKEFLINTNIPSNDIITEELSRNTHENAAFTAQLIQKDSCPNLLLITSAMHMHRANKCFIKNGLQCDIYPTDHYSGARDFNIDNLLIPSAKTLADWHAFIHELLGIISYKIAGYI